MKLFKVIYNMISINSKNKLKGTRYLASSSIDKVAKECPNAILIEELGVIKIIK